MLQTHRALEIKRPLTETAPVSDEQLVRQVLDGNRRAFERLVRRHQTGLVNHLFRQTGQRELAVDLAQEVFLKVYTALPSFNPKYRFTTWVYRIATNRAIDLMRRKTLPVCSLDEADHDLTRHTTLADETPAPDEVLACAELQARLKRAIDDLPGDYRRLLLLRNREHYRYDEIAWITGLPIGTVKNRIFRAREILRQTLNHSLDEIEAPAS
ncbi:MAG: sigma-70 family RNA polymerase sigma factor [Acidobacteria bacterium]|nr:sigma-70 family RNA polymerase sigma factor [Acidobacteriota bacterium]NIO59233.1 sigma-70 family RNA polymerase sigma factor [Acidobacteriota bacterium]NIT10943.1 sigma-70 family RNA polymerase sigma factor [Acidobacteriota bacterium]